MVGHSRGILPPLSASCAELPKEGSRSAFSVQILRLRRVELTLDSGFPLQRRAAVLCWQPRVDGTSRAHPFVQLLYHSIHLKGMLSLLAAVSRPFSFTRSKRWSMAIHSNFYCLLAKLQSKYALRGICEIMCRAWFVSVFFPLPRVKGTKRRQASTIITPMWLESMRRFLYLLKADLGHCSFPRFWKSAWQVSAVSLK